MGIDYDPVANSDCPEGRREGAETLAELGHSGVEQKATHEGARCSEQDDAYSHDCEWLGYCKEIL